MRLYTCSEGVELLKEGVQFYAWTENSLEYELTEDEQNGNYEIEVTENFRCEGENVYLITSRSNARLIK